MPNYSLLEVVTYDGPVTTTTPGFLLALYSILTSQTVKFRHLLSSQITDKVGIGV